MNVHAETQPVLIIEDDQKTAHLVSLYLDKEGFKSVLAQDGREGLKLAERHNPALVILDLMLPQIDGWEVCREIRRRSDVPILMLTARGDENSTARLSGQLNRGRTHAAGSAVDQHRFPFLQPCLDEEINKRSQKDFGDGRPLFIAPIIRNGDQHLLGHVHLLGVTTAW